MGDYKDQQCVLEDEIEDENGLDVGNPQLLDEHMPLFNPNDIDIIVEPLSLDNLIKRIQHHEIDMNTDFQRHADLWDNKKMSRLIESILIRFPLPSFYFDASNESNWLVVDGLQRLSAIRKFVINKELRLSGLEFLTELNGQTYDRLHRQYQRRIEECHVTVYKIRPGTPVDVKYSLFRRINTGGLTLNNQEIRNALAQKKDRALLEKLAQSKYSKAMFGNLSKRMKDQELVLRFWAFYRFNYLEPKNKAEIASFLDKAMEDIKKGDDSLHLEIQAQYLMAIERCYFLLGDKGFEKAPQPKGRTINASLFEVWMVSLAKLTDVEFDNLLQKRKIFRDRVQALLCDGEFVDSISYNTQRKNNVEIRYKKVNALIKGVLND